MYSIKVDYAPYSSRKTNIERIFYINDEVPFSQARYMNFLKTWTFNYVEQEDGTVRFAKDASGNEQRPDAQCELKWNTWSSPIRIHIIRLLSPSTSRRAPTRYRSKACAMKCTFPR